MRPSVVVQRLFGGSGVCVRSRALIRPILFDAFHLELAALQASAQDGDSGAVPDETDFARLQFPVATALKKSPSTGTLLGANQEQL